MNSLSIQANTHNTEENSITIVTLLIWRVHSINVDDNDSAAET